MSRYNNQELDLIDHLSKKIFALERRVKQLENNKKPTIPVYDLGALPDLVSGQIFISTTNTLRFTRGGSVFNAGP